MPHRPYVIDEMISAKSIAARVEALAKEITVSYRGTNKLVVVGLLRGSFVFIAQPLSFPWRECATRRSLRSNSCRESAVEARGYARRARSCVPRRLKLTPAGPRLPRKPRAVMFHLADCGERCRKGPPGQGAGRLCGAEERRMAGRARTRALPLLTRGNCLSAATEGSAASFAAGRPAEHRRAVGAPGADRRSEAPRPARAGLCPRPTSQWCSGFQFYFKHPASWRTRSRRRAR